MADGTDPEAKMKRNKTATEYVAAIRANVDSYYSVPNTPENYQSFGDRQRGIWNEICARPRMQDRVLAILRNDPWGA
jgi:hypothetical protein